MNGAYYLLYGTGPFAPILYYWTDRASERGANEATPKERLSLPTLNKEREREREMGGKERDKEKEKKRERH